MNIINFAKGAWQLDALQKAYSFRFTETPPIRQKDGYIASDSNPRHREGFDNISLLTKETYSVGAKATLRCAFGGKGCPEIILVEKPEVCPDGEVRYGACFEVVLYRHGVNVWRHFMDEDHKCRWYKLLGVKFPVAEDEIHTLHVEIRENYFAVSVDGMEMLIRVEDIFEKFYFGLTLCEGVARAYDFTVEEG